MDTEEYWIKLVQQQGFSEEIKDLKQSEPLSKSGHLFNLHPFVDPAGFKSWWQGAECSDVILCDSPSDFPREASCNFPPHHVRTSIFDADWTHTTHSIAQSSLLLLLDVTGSFAQSLAVVLFVKNLQPSQRLRFMDNCLSNASHLVTYLITLDSIMLDLSQ